MIFGYAGGFAAVWACLVGRCEDSFAVATQSVRVKPCCRMSFVQMLLKGAEVRLGLSTDTAVPKEKLTLLRRRLGQHWHGDGNRDSVPIFQHKVMLRGRFRHGSRLSKFA